MSKYELAEELVNLKGRLRLFNLKIKQKNRSK